MFFAVEDLACKVVWISASTFGVPISQLKNKVTKMNALVWNKGRWNLHLFPLPPALSRTINSAQARFLRHILKVPAAFVSRVSHEEIRRRCSTFSFSTSILRSQFR